MSEMIALTSGISLEVLDLSIISSAINWGKQDPRLAYIGIFDEDNEPVSTFNPGDISLDVSEALKTKEIFEIKENFFYSNPHSLQQNQIRKCHIRVILKKLLRKYFKERNNHALYLPRHASFRSFVILFL
jgi:hypothetical protein